MKTIISTIFLCVLLSFIPELRAQNIQLHYDFGRSLYDKDLKERPLLTSTVEKFHPDTWGSTYFFVDMDYTSEGVASAYWEIAREVKFWKGPFSAHLEYNGGLAKGFSYKNAYLAGATYTYNNASFSKGFSTSTLSSCHLSRVLTSFSSGFSSLDSFLVSLTFSIMLTALLTVSALRIPLACN